MVSVPKVDGGRPSVRYTLLNHRIFAIAFAKLHGVSSTTVRRVMAELTADTSDFSFHKTCHAGLLIDEVYRQQVRRLLGKYRQ